MGTHSPIEQDPTCATAFYWENQENPTTAQAVEWAGAVGVQRIAHGRVALVGHTSSIAPHWLGQGFAVPTSHFTFFLCLILSPPPPVVAGDPS